MERQQFVWSDSSVIDFVNWYLKLHNIDSRFELENQYIIDSFKNGDTPDMWNTKEDTSNEEPIIDYDDFVDIGEHRYWYKYKSARHRVDICLGTKDPKKYVNGIYLYSEKDPGTGIEFVVVKTNNPYVPINSFIK